MVQISKVVPMPPIPKYRFDSCADEDNVKVVVEEEVPLPLKDTQSLEQKKSERMIDAQDKLRMESDQKCTGCSCVLL